jgi:hypothetical protein
MVTIWDVYEYNLLRLNKDQSGRSITIPQFNLAAVIASYEYFKLKVGLPEQYQPGKPFPAQAWQVSKKITDDMQHLLKWMGGPDNPQMNIDKYGIAELPSDYFAFSSCYYNYVVQNSCDDIDTKPKEVDFLTDAEWSDRLNSVIVPPELEYPVAKMGAGKIQFAPRNLKKVDFTYLREPAAPVLAFTYDANNDYVYDAANSTQFDFPQVCLPDIANLIFAVMSGNLKSQLDIQLAEQRKVQGI